MKLALSRGILIIEIRDLAERRGILGVSDDMTLSADASFGDASGVPAYRKNLNARGFRRVSTTRQAEGELSLPEQRDAIARRCATRSWKLVDDDVDAGASGTEEDRPAFQRMIERALDDDHPFELIVVHSLSRFFRDSSSTSSAAFDGSANSSGAAIHMSSPGVAAPDKFWPPDFAPPNLVVRTES